ncbi:MAG TPA: KH domain-containing protein [Actinomycetota bacterium]|nr:KH domain-containing protein [Actinomycetota bacterium]
MGSRETLEYIVSWLVEYPDDVRVEEDDSGRTVVYDLFLHPDDVGRVIGRSGRVARAIRTVVKAAAAKEDRNALVEIND